MSIARTFYTVRTLKAQQVVGQVRNRLRPFLERPERFYRRPSPDFPGTSTPPARMLAPGTRRDTAENLTSGRFEFLNESGDLGWPPDWDAPGKGKLWQYNLHYFEWLWTLEYEDAKRAAQDWTAHHNLAMGRVGWEPYPTSLRLINWCAVFFGKFGSRVESDRTFVSELWRSIFLQTEWLARHLETHLLGNHLIENGSALIIVGGCFRGPAAGVWSDIGRSILEKELPEQILPDGMHFERSPMYHLRMTYLLLALSVIERPDIKALVNEPLRRMLAATKTLYHPDGQIALLNDSAFGIYNTPRELLSFARSLSDFSVSSVPSDYGPFALPDAGYYGAREENGAYVICDAGPIAPDHLPGHAHGDIFSFELSLRGQRVIVDSGVFDYETGEMRAYCRSTKAHNTVEINGQDQCEFWGAFRVARRGRPRDVCWQPSDAGFYLRGAYDGYRSRLSGGFPQHVREFTWLREGILEIEDHVTASRSADAVARFHLHPECSVEKIEEGKVSVSYPGGFFRIAFSDNVTPSIGTSWYCPEFGKKYQNPVLAFSSSGKRIDMRFRIGGF